MALKQGVHRLIGRFGYRLSRIEEPMRLPWLDVLDLLVTARLRENPDFVFVQIGANDGVTEDPVGPLIERHRLRGLSVEPQPRAFERLLENRQHHPGLRFENAIIGESDGVATLFVPADDACIPEGWNQAASLDRAQLVSVLGGHLRNSGKPVRPDDLVTPVQLPSLTLPTLLARHEITSLDLLVLDTMGFDFRIIRQIPFASTAPALIHFEHRLLPSDERIACFELLAGHGYSFCHVDMDTIAARNGPVRGRRWAPAALDTRVPGSRPARPASA